MYESPRFFRAVMKELLAKNAKKIRFYIHAETYDDGNKGLFGAIIGTGFKYHFRYYLH